MSSALRRIVRRTAAVFFAAAAGAVGLPLITGGAGAAEAAVTVQCSSRATIFGANSVNDMWINYHNAPATGADDFTHHGNTGGGWSGKVLAGTNGYVYSIPGNGEVRRSQWNGTSFGSSQVIASSADWHGWADPVVTNRITIDSNNHFYAVPITGNLEQRIYNEATQAWTSKVIATGWGRFDMIAAAGNGVIYARDPSINSGILLRYQYDNATGQWLGNARTDMPGNTGANNLRQLFSPGGEILYGIDKTEGRLFYYRYDPHTNTWPVGRIAMGTGWGDIRNASATTNTCNSTVPADSFAQCAPRVTIFGANAANEMWINYHNEPETGINDFTHQGNTGSGWAGKVVAGHNGHVYVIPGNGEIRRRIWNGSAFHSEQVLATTGWSGWNEPPVHNRITVDSNNHFYAVPASGNLEQRIFNETTQTWSSRTIATGWGRFDMIAAAGNGVIYARDPNINSGALFRHRYDSATGRWLEYGRSDMPGNTGANYLKQLFSPGADVLYGIDNTEGRLYEYRFDAAGNTWNLPRVGLNTGWGDIRNASATTNECALRNDPPIVRPPVAAPANERAQVLLNPSNGKLEIVYISNDGILRRGYQSSPGSEFVEWQAMSGGDGHTGRASAAFRADGRLVLAAHDRNADIRTYTQTASGSTSWGNPVLLGGAMLSAPILAKGQGDLLTAFAADGNGKLWYTTQTAAADELLPWRQATSAGDYTMSADFAAMPAGDGFEIVFRDNTNTMQARKFVGGALQAARVAGGLTTAGVPAAVRFADGKVQIAARGADGIVYTQKEGTAGFAGWQPIAGLTAKGSPSAVLNPHGIIEVTIRSDGDEVHRTGQTAPGSATWRTWVTNFDLAAADPTLVSVSGSESRIFYVDPAGNFHLAQHVPYTSESGRAAPR